MTERYSKDYKIDYKYNFKEYISFISKYKFMIAILLIVVIFNEAKQVLDRYLFKIILDRAADFTTGTLIINNFVNILIIIALIFLGVTSLNLIANWLKLHYINRLELKAIFDIKQRYFSHLIDLDHNFHTTHKTGSLISRLGRGAYAMERLTDTILFEFAPLFFQAIVAFFALFYLSKMQSIIIFFFMIIFLSFSLIMQRLSEKYNVEANKMEDIEKGNMADFFTNVDSIRYFGKEEFIKNRYKKLTEKTKQINLINWDFYRITAVGQSLIIALGTFMVIFFSIKSFLAGTITIGTLAFIYTTYGGLIIPLFGFVYGVRNVSRSMADFQDLFAYGKIKKEVKDKLNAKPIKIEHGQIEFDNVCFNYDKKRKIFSNFNLKIPKHKKIAFVGHSGSGKSTLVKLLYRFYDVNDGKILIDNQDIKDVTQNSLRNEMSVVPQECVLFDDTIYNNILFSNPKATKKQVLEAIKFAQLDGFIKNLPDKEETIVGERGVKLSGGEKQRVSIARAILANKKILVLDEATSSLDSETEHEIQKDLARLMEGRTSIIIAHRLSTIMHADLIVVIKDGKIVQTGKHYQLINQSGEYKRLWNLQKGGYIK